MAKNVFSIIEGLISELSALKRALSPLAAFAGLTGSAPAKKAPAKKRAAPKKAKAKRRAAKPAAKVAPKAAAMPAAKAAPKKRKAPKSTPQLRAMRAQQGRYMGLLRSLTKPQQAQVKKLRSEKGYPAALEMAASLSKSK